MLDRVDGATRLALRSLAAGSCLLAVGVGGRRVVRATLLPDALAVPLVWVGNVGAALVVVCVFTIGLKLVRTFA